MHGLPSYIRRAVTLQSVQEPRAGGRMTIRSQPQLRMQRKQAVTGKYVPLHDWPRIGCIDNPCNVDAVALKSGIGLVCGEEEFKAIVHPKEGIAQGNFTKILKLRVITNRHFAQAEQARKTHIEHAEKKHVIVIRGTHQFGSYGVHMACC